MLRVFFSERIFPFIVIFVMPYASGVLNYPFITQAAIKKIPHCMQDDCIIMTSHQSGSHISDI